MRSKKISQLERAKFTSKTIDNCYYVERTNPFELKVVSFIDIFNWIKETAIKEGLTVKMVDSKIMFIKGNKE